MQSAARGIAANRSRRTGALIARTSATSAVALSRKRGFQNPNDQKDGKIDVPGRCFS
jgi:hypothetical protein